MATFINNLRAVQPRLQGTTLGQAMNNTLPTRNNTVPSNEDIAKWQNWKKANSFIHRDNIQTPAAISADMGTLFVDTEGSTPAANSSLYDFERYVDKSIFDNKEKFSNMIDDYVAAGNTTDGEKVLNKYSETLGSKSQSLAEVIDFFARQNKIIQDSDEYNGNQTDNNMLGDYMRQFLDAAQSKYSPQEI